MNNLARFAPSFSSAVALKGAGPLAHLLNMMCISPPPVLVVVDTRIRNKDLNRSCMGGGGGGGESRRQFSSAFAQTSGGDHFGSDGHHHENSTEAQPLELEKVTILKVER